MRLTKVANLFSTRSIPSKNTKIVSHEKLFNLSQKMCASSPFQELHLTWFFRVWNDTILKQKAVFAVGGGVVSDERWNWYEKQPCGRISGSFSFDVFVIKCQLILFYGAVVESFLKSTIVIDSLDKLREWVLKSFLLEFKFLGESEIIYSMELKNLNGYSKNFAFFKHQALPTNSSPFQQKSLWKINFYILCRIVWTTSVEKKGKRFLLQTKASFVVCFP